MTEKPIIAIMYDFDKTLCTKDMQDYAFIPSLNMTPKEFWGKANDVGTSLHMDSVLAYMYTMLLESREKNLPLTRKSLTEKGNKIEFFPGVKEWFQRINRFGEENGVVVEYYVISSGLKEIIEGTAISNEFKEIYGCEFVYGDDGVAVFPKTAVNYTNKTQFVYRINKGVLDVANDEDLNKSMPDDSKRIPFCNMIYIGDGLSDVPCMKMMKSSPIPKMKVERMMFTMLNSIPRMPIIPMMSTQLSSIGRKLSMASSMRPKESHRTKKMRNEEM